MRQKRAKTYKRLMELYSRSFGFRQPYQVLVDSSFCTYCAQKQMDVPKQLGNVLQGQLKQMITQCSIVELYKLGPSHQATVDLAKAFERRKCNHREAIPGEDCIKSVVGETNKHRYVVATQSQSLREYLRTIPSVPVVHVNRVVMVLEPPSEVTLRAKALQETEAQEVRPTERAAIAATLPAVTEPPRKKRKGPKNPNPLSVKKKKPKPNVAGSSVSNNIMRDDGTLNATRVEGPDVGSGGVSVGEKRKRPAERSDESLIGSPKATLHDEVVADGECNHNPPTGLGGIRRKKRRHRGRGVSENQVGSAQVTTA